MRDLLKVSSIMQFNTFLRLCATRIGSIFKASELAGEVGVSSNTIMAWMSVLEASYVVQLLPPYFDNSHKRLVKSPKLYFCDTGLACSLLDIESREQLRRDKMRGPLFENFIVNEALKSRYNSGRGSNLYFYRDSNQNEIDLVLMNASGLTGIEVKLSMTYHEEFEKSLRQMAKWTRKQIEKRAVVYTGEYENDKADIQLINFANINSIL